MMLIKLKYSKRIKIQPNLKSVNNVTSTLLRASISLKGGKYVGSFSTVIILLRPTDSATLTFSLVKMQLQDGAFICSYWPAMDAMINYLCKAIFDSI